jgi:hypothetical protein
VAFGVYPHLNVADAHVALIRNDVEHCVHASRILNMERFDLEVGPIRIEVVEPLKTLKVILAPTDGLACELTFEGRAFPIEEPRFIRRNGPRTFMDYTRLTQNGRYTGWLEVDGKRESVDGFVGTRDRSWGIRPVGARDQQELAPPQPGQFFWIWSPTNFPAGSFFFHTNDEASGEPWNRRAVWARDGANATQHAETKDSDIQIEWKSGTRHAKKAVVTLRGEDGVRKITYEPEYEFFMLGLGYGHPKWGHGQNHGELAVEREDFKLADVDPRMPHHLHVQALCKVTYEGGNAGHQEGRGVLEQLAIGPHAPSGFKQMLDYAP